MNKHKMEVNERNGMGLERQGPRMGRLERSVARKGPIQLSAPMAEAGLDARDGSRIRRMAPRISHQPMDLRKVSMATEVVVGPLGVWPPLLPGDLRSVSLAGPSGTVLGVLVR